MVVETAGITDRFEPYATDPTLMVVLQKQQNKKKQRRQLIFAWRGRLLIRPINVDTDCRATFISYKRGCWMLAAHYVTIYYIKDCWGSIYKRFIFFRARKA